MRGAHPEHELERIFIQHSQFAKGTTAIVALSGGSDSVALAALAASRAAQIRSSLVLVHINHQTRPSSLQDEAVALAVSARLAHPLVICSLALGSTDEARLRRERYAQLCTVARQRGASYVMTGHTADDQTETVLLALFRGTGRDGLLGMPLLRELEAGIFLERPLLRIDHGTLRRYCERRQLPYVVDPSNEDLRYRRNIVRRALAMLRPSFPGLDRSVARCADLLRQDVEAPEVAAQARVLKDWLKEKGACDTLSAKRLGALLQLVELGRGRRVRLSLEWGEQKSRYRTFEDRLDEKSRMEKRMSSQDPLEPPLVPPLARVIYHADEIADAVRGLAVEVLAAIPFTAELVLLTVLEGARRFGEDLHRAIVALPQSVARVVIYATVGASSYDHETESSGNVVILSEPTVDIQGRHVVLVDDILDRGHTMRCLMAYCQKAKPESLRSCVLFDKRDVRRDFFPDFVGLEVPPVFVVGYGLDYQEKFRNLPYLAALDEASVNRKLASGVRESSRQRENA